MVALRSMNLDYNDSCNSMPLSLRSARGASLSELEVPPDSALPRDGLKSHRCPHAPRQMWPSALAWHLASGVLSRSPSLSQGSWIRLMQDALHIFEHQIMPRLLRSWQRLRCRHDLRVVFKHGSWKTVGKRGLACSLEGRRWGLSMRAILRTSNHLKMSQPWRPCLLGHGGRTVAAVARLGRT